VQGRESRAKALRDTIEAAAGKTETALVRMQQELEAHLERDIAKLTAVRETMGAYPPPEQIGQLYMRVHDIKGLGATSGYPIVSELAAQLCRIIDDDRYEFCEQSGLINDHIDAIVAMFRKRVRTPEHPEGRRILAELRRDCENR
jgi:hypothetical protein